MSDAENVKLPLEDPSPIPSMSAFSIMFVSIGFSCFVWQTLTAGEMFYKSRKPIVALVCFQALFGVIVTFVTLLASLTEVDCMFVSIQPNNSPFSNALFVVACVLGGGRQYWRYHVTDCFIVESVFRK